MTTKELLLIFGAGGHAKSVIDTVLAEGKYTILGLIDSTSEVGAEVLGCAVIGAEADLPQLSNRYACANLLIAVGDNYQRHSASNRILGLLPSAKFATTIHPFSSVSPAAIIGDGVVIMPGAVVNAGSRVGDGCLVNTRASIDHDCALREFSSVAPGVTLGGRVIIGERASVGLGANVRNAISIGADTVVGVGSVVIRNFPELVLAYGVPCQVVRQRQADEPYL